ncbi:HPP family protein [Sulfurospirillum oryzae]|uniref:HPP family protein n=1 Tax=Sulfurospirillum oryzae TaxID=2976535 RepID=UPI0021E8E1E3|nr:HPP family protein [Sulfurospirillum oryzae]
MKAKSQPPSRKPLSKILWSGFGAFLGIYLVAIFGHYFAIEESFFLLGSFGASAVLIYGAPQADFSQPRNIIGGHILSACVAVFLLKTFSSLLSTEFLCALSVSLSIVVMHFSRTMHPPGGATALIYVMGGEQIHRLGWLYPFTPIGFGALIMLLVALLINNLSSNSKRHYPTYWF